MTDIQDSSEIPTGELSPDQKRRRAERRREDRRIAQIADTVISSRLHETHSRLDRAEDGIEQILKKQDEIIRYCEHLDQQAKLSETRRLETLDRISIAKADTRSMQRTTDRTDKVVALVRKLILKLEPFSDWLSETIREAHALDDRKYGSDGTDITDLIDKRRYRRRKGDS